MIEISRIETKLGKKIEKNNVIEKQFSLKRNSIEKLVGIQKRYISNKNETSERNAIKVCRKIPRSVLKSISHIISVTNTPSIKFPGISNFISSALKMENVHCINLNLGCTGYVDALSIAYDIISAEKKSNILIVTSDTYSKFINPKNRSIRPLFSDGASASIVKYSKKGFRNTKRKFKNIANTEKDLCFGKNEIFMDGPAVLSFAIKYVLPEIKKYQNFSSSIYLHQAGNIVYNQIKKNIDKKVFLPKNFHKYGNLVSSSIPYLIKDNFTKFKKSKNLILCGFGVGLSLSLLILKR